MNDAGSGAVSIRQARAEDHGACVALLQRACLPVADIDPGSMSEFIVAESGSGIVGLIGLEQSAPVGLLRSLAVVDAARGCGIGAILVGALETRARDLGVRDLWLLTIDADGYFSSKGFTTRQRNDAPESIARTREFSELCPDNAVLMKKTLRSD